MLISVCVLFFPLPSSFFFFFHCRYFPVALDGGSRPLFSSMSALRTFHLQESSQPSPISTSSLRRGVSSARCVVGLACGLDGGTRVVVGGGRELTNFDVKHQRILSYEIRIRIPSELKKCRRHVLLCRGERRSLLPSSRGGGGSEAEEAEEARSRGSFHSGGFGSPRSHNDGSENKNKTGGYDVGVTHDGRLYVLVHDVGTDVGSASRGTREVGLFQTAANAVASGSAYHLMINLRSNPASVDFHVDGVHVPLAVQKHGSSASITTSSTSSFFSSIPFSSSTSETAKQVNILPTISPLVLGGRRLAAQHVRPNMKLPFSSVSSLASPLSLGGDNSSSGDGESSKYETPPKKIRSEKNQQWRHQGIESKVELYQEETKGDEEEESVVLKSETNVLERRVGSKDTVKAAGGGWPLDKVPTRDWTGAIYMVRLWRSALTPRHYWLHGKRNGVI